MNINDMLIQGAIDFHVHTAPDICPRKYTDIQLAEECRKAGMSGFVSKCHQGDTSARASAVSELFPDLKVFGGIVLNHVVGGLNEEAVYACGKMGGKMAKAMVQSNQSKFTERGFARQEKEGKP